MASSHKNSLTEFLPLHLKFSTLKGCFQMYRLSYNCQVHTYTWKFTPRLTDVYGQIQSPQFKEFTSKRGFDYIAASTQMITFSHTQH